MILKNYPKSLLFLISLFLSFYTSAKTIEVNSKATFDKAMLNAVAGDVILWLPGEYADVDMLIGKSKLTVRAKVIGRTIFTGASKVSIKGNNVVFEGFQFLGGAIGKKNVIDVFGSFNRISKINISGYTSWKYLVIRESSQKSVVTKCNFENRLNLDDKNILSILVHEKIPGRHKVEYCSFRNFKGDGGDLGIEAVRIGVSTQAEFSSQSIIEYCYFTQCNGDGEIISNKAADNVIRYNTFINNPVSEVVLRHGDGAAVYGNFFLNGKGGVRVKEGQNHSIYNNYFSGLKDRSIRIQNTEADPVKNVTIAYNTFVNTGKVKLNDSKGDNAPKGISFYNNLFSNAQENIFSNATGSEKWEGNFYEGKLGIKPSNGLYKIKPMLEKNKYGFYQISFRSPVINKSATGLQPISCVKELLADSNILLDITKTTRPKEQEKKDVGCYEFFISSKIKPHAHKGNTGPKYLITQRKEREKAAQQKKDAALARARKAEMQKKLAIANTQNEAQIRSGKKVLTRLDSLKLREMMLKRALDSISTK